MLRAAKWAVVVVWGMAATVPAAPDRSRISLENAALIVDPAEPQYVQYGAKDLAAYLSQIAGTEIRVSAARPAGPQTRAVVGVGAAAAKTLGLDVQDLATLNHDGFVLRTVEGGNSTVVVAAGRDPHGTNAALATLMQSVRAEGRVPYLEGPLQRHESPAFARRGIHLNGWPLNYPYAFRSWKEADWKRFVDIAWTQRINLFYLWPFMEILPVPLTAQDRAYLEEVRRVVQYAQQERGMEVWIMQSANRIGLTDCGSLDPRFRAYWVNECQKDMNPADPQQFDRILKSFETFYSIVDNADAYVMIDSDPGGWPQSPLSDQLKIFQAARRLLTEHSTRGAQTMLVDWMHVGWGRHKFFTSTDAVVGAYDWTDKNPDESDVTFMGETIRMFKGHLEGPWGLIAGQPPYLSVVKDEHVLDRTVYLPYGAIESEPAFPATNLGQEAVRKVFDRANAFPGLRGVMGNNQLMLLQFPRSYYFFATAWNSSYEQRSEADVLLDLAEQLYPDQKQLIAAAYLALKEADSAHVGSVLARLNGVLRSGDLGRPGALGRLLFPDPWTVARSLALQLEVRAARQTLIAAMRGKPTVDESARLVSAYFDRLLAWNRETGWDKMIDITVWPRPIYETGKDLTEAASRLKQILASGAPYTSYARIQQFFQPIARDLVQKYGEESVMVGCVEPFKLAVVQSQ